MAVGEQGQRGQAQRFLCADYGTPNGSVQVIPEARGAVTRAAGVADVAAAGLVIDIGGVCIGEGCGG